MQNLIHGEDVAFFEKRSSEGSPQKASCFERQQRYSEDLRLNDSSLETSFTHLADKQASYLELRLHTAIRLDT